MSFLARAPSPHPPTKTPTTAGFSTAVTREMQLKDTEKYSLQNQRNIILNHLLVPTTTPTTAGFTGAISFQFPPLLAEHNVHTLTRILPNPLYFQTITPLVTKPNSI